MNDQLEKAQSMEETFTLCNRRLQLAAREDNPNLMKTVLESSLPMPYDVNARDGAGNTPLLIACANGSVNVMEPLLEQEVDVDAQNSLTGNTPLHEACLLEDEEVRNWIVTELIAAGADPAVTNFAGEKPIDKVYGPRAKTPLGEELIATLEGRELEDKVIPDDIAEDGDLEADVQGPVPSDAGRTGSDVDEA